MHILRIEKLRIKAPIGIYHEEHVLGNTIEINIGIAYKPTFYNDTLQDCIDYTAVIAFCKKTLQKPYATLEFACQELGTAIKNLHPQIEKVQLKLSKVHPPISAELHAVSIEMEF